MSTTLALASVACGGHPATSTGDGGGSGSGSGGVFFANASSFAPFRTWTEFDDTLVDTGNLPAGVAGSRQQYINVLPPHRATEFPIGTIVVEVRDDGKIFSSVKVGGGYNAAGCKNWEFYELTENPLKISWNGVGPPSGDTYGGDPNGCNDCHTQCASNDYICSPKIQLASF